MSTLAAQISADIDRLVQSPQGLAEQIIVSPGGGAEDLTLPGWWLQQPPPSLEAPLSPVARADAWLRPADLPAPLAVAAYALAGDPGTWWTLDQGHRPTQFCGLWTLHLYRADLVQYQPPSGPPQTLRGMWSADAWQRQDQGIGAQRYDGSAQFTVSQAELPDPAQTHRILRQGRTYDIARVDAIADHAWRLHLRLPQARAGNPLRGGQS